MARGSELLTKTPTRRISPATCEAIVEAFSGEQYRFDEGQKFNPRAATLSFARRSASLSVVTPQIFREGIEEKNSSIISMDRAEVTFSGSTGNDGMSLPRKKISGKLIRCLNWGLEIGLIWGASRARAQKNSPVPESWASWQNTVKVAERTGLEPATSGVTGRRSNQLSYRSALPVRTAGR